MRSRRSILRFRSFWNLALSPFRLDTMAFLYTPILSVRPGSTGKNQHIGQPDSGTAGWCVNGVGLTEVERFGSGMSTPPPSKFAVTLPARFGPATT
jgi:hypothetical protein